MHKVCHKEAGGRTGSARPRARSSQQGFEMQSLQRVPCRQTIQFLEPSSLCPAAMHGRSHLPIQKQEKTAEQVDTKHLMWRAAKEPAVIEIDSPP